MKPNDFFSDLFNVGGQVLDLASGIAGLIGTTDDDPKPYDLGSVVFAQDEGKYYVANQTNSDLSLNMCQTLINNGQLSTTSSLVSIPTGPNAVDITTPMDLYQSGGNFTIGPTIVPTPSNTVTTAISFAVRAISFASAVAIVGGITGSFGQDPTTKIWSFTIKSTGPLINFGSKVKVTGGNNVTASVNVQPPQGDDSGFTAVAYFPDSMDLSPTITDLEIELLVDDSSKIVYEKLPTRPVSKIPAFKHLV